MSRRHIRVNIEGHRFFATDLRQSENGECRRRSIDLSQPAHRGAAECCASVIRCWSCRARTSRRRPGMASKSKTDAVIGPTLHMLLTETATAARFGNAPYITGESGTGKEFIARSFHVRLGPNREGRFVPVNCAAIPQGLAERLLFGTRRGPIPGFIDAGDPGSGGPPTLFRRGRRSGSGASQAAAGTRASRSFCRWGCVTNDRASGLFRRTRTS